MSAEKTEAAGRRGRSRSGAMDPRSENINKQEIQVGKRIVVVNAGPRKGWNTDTLLSEAARGAESAGAELAR